MQRRGTPWNCPAEGQEKSGAFSPAFSVGWPVAVGNYSRPADRRQAPTKEPGGRQRVDRQTATPAAHDGTGGGFRHRAGERTKAGCQGDGQPRREGVYEPGTVSWELIYAPIAPQQGAS